MKYGPMTVERHLKLKRSGKDLAVIFNGSDITRRCLWADDVAGEVQILCRDPEKHDWKRTEGSPHLIPDHDGGPCTHTLKGDVSFVELVPHG